MSLSFFPTPDLLYVARLEGAEIVNMDMMEYPTAIQVIKKKDIIYKQCKYSKRSYCDCYYPLQLLLLNDKNPFACSASECNYRRIRASEGSVVYSVDKENIDVSTIISKLFEDIVKITTPTSSVCVVIPDYYEQRRRKTIISLMTEAIKNDKVSVSLVNQSAAVMMNMKRQLTDNNERTILTLRFDDGPLQVAVYSVSPEGYVPLGSFTDPSLCGTHLISRTVDQFIETMSDEAKEEYANHREDEKKKLRLDFWNNVCLFLQKHGEGDEPILDLDNVDDFQMELFDTVLSSCLDSMDNAVMNCMLLANVDKMGIDIVVVSGIWGSYNLVQSHMKEYFDKAMIVYLSDEDICKSALVQSQLMSPQVKQCLQSTITIKSSTEDPQVICDLFTAYPCVIKKDLCFPLNTVFQKSLTVTQSTLSDPLDVTKEAVDVSSACIVHEDILLESTISVDSNGLISLALNDNIATIRKSTPLNLK